MAICLRRVLSSRSLLFLRASHRCSNLSLFSYLVSGQSARAASSIGFRGGFDRLGSDFLFGNRRGFAKGRKSRNEDDGDTVQVVPDIGPTVKSIATSQMEAAIAALARELSKLRTGRASAGMLDHIVVETGGAKIPLNHVAVVSVIDAQTLSVTPYDPDLMTTSSFSINAMGPLIDISGHDLWLRLTKENMQALCKVVAKSAEDVKQSIRRARQKVEEMTKRFIKSADDMCKAKEKEITGS
ncbi:ribosome-recycling factor [Cocos nucifera]|uniref:Ribosome-recycling factor, chloroplastic n=1 Tax=Cocos nucifera TaxID=13894 RepID=A0A8K0MXC3_COCNU|nr:ribosome-recycling factor [Cocos nucifera]